MYKTKQIRSNHVANSSGLANVGLRYVNHIELSHRNETLEEYFRVIPQIPPPIPQAFPTFLLNVDIPYNSPSSVLRIIFGTVVPKIPGDLAYVLDLNIYSMNDNVPSNKAIPDWLEVAHERIEVAFHASFSGAETPLLLPPAQIW